MAITRVRAYHLDQPHRRGAYRMSHGGSPLFVSTVVSLETDAGITGWGEVAMVGAFYSEAFTGGARAGIADLAPLLLGLDATRPRAVLARLDRVMRGQLYIKSAIDMACWDAAGKAAGRPLCDLLGGRVGESVALYNVVTAGTPEDEAVALAHTLLDEGYRRIQVKVGGEPVRDARRLRAVREAVGPDVTILTGAGSNDTAHAVRMAEQGAENGADGILALTPYYSKPTQAGVVAHFRAILGATSLPVMIYDIPGRTALAVSDWALDELAAHPRIVAVKDATGNVDVAKERIERTGLAWYSGDDPLTLDFMRAGASGVVSVSSHIASREIAAMIAAFNAGDMAEAERIDEALAPVHAAIFNGPGAINAKSAMYWAGVIPSRAMRLPLLPANDAEYGALTAALEAAGMTR